MNRVCVFCHKISSYTGVRVVSKLIAKKYVAIPTATAKPCSRKAVLFLFSLQEADVLIL